MEPPDCPTKISEISVIQSVPILIILIPAWLIFEDIRLPMNGMHWLFFICNGVLFAFAGIFPIAALHYIPAVEFALVGSASMPFCMVLQYTILVDLVPPKKNSMEVLGCCLSILGIVLCPIHQLCHNYWKRNDEEKKKIIPN